MKQPIVKTILRAIALALGVAAFILSILGAASPATQISILSIGLLAVALSLFL